MAQKIRDLAVKTGEYVSNGETKGRWQNVGALMKGDDGGEFIILHRWFNPAGVPNPDNKDSILVSCFKLQDRQQGGQQQPPQQHGGYGAPQGQQQYQAPPPDPSDEIPF